MLQSITQLYGAKLCALDGKIGHVKDFYFDDQSWVIRFLVVDTGSWLSGRQVLISPHSLGKLGRGGEVVGVNLTLQQIEDSPPIETHKPVSRQFEEDYYQYYGWPGYWLGDGLWGMSGVPIMDLPGAHPAAASQQAAKRADAHLRSTHEVDGYHVQASDGKVGHVYDCMVDPQTWAVRQIIIKTDHWLSGREVEIPPSKVDRISYEESTVFVNLTKAAVEQSPTHFLTSAGVVE